MTQDHSSKLSFSIEESVWLNKDQEVDEIVSLSLEPDVTVQESGEYVLIRGGLKLTGEYRSNGNSNPNEEVTSLSDQVGFRSIEEVTVNEDGTGEIRHYFPIDVTIPQERISSLDDIYVLVESFDYDLPERGCIQLTADVAITGMSTGNIVTEKSQARDEITEPGEQEDRSFHYEAYGETEPEFEEEEVIGEEIEELIESEDWERPPVEPLELTILNPSEAEVSEQPRTEYQEDNPKDEIEIDVDLSVEAKKIEVVTEVPEVKIPSVAFGVIKERPKQEATAKSETETMQPDQNQEKPYGMLKNLAGDRRDAKQQAKQPTLYHVESEQGQETPESDKRGEVSVVEVPLQEEAVEGKLAKEENENALYLTKMLTKGEEKFKKLKMCIVQEDETLDIVASRYEINQSALIRVNRLNGSNIEAGQILYIPARQ